MFICHYMNNYKKNNVFVVNKFVNMTREYLNSISKPFGFDSREKAKKILRRHSYSGGDTVRPEPQFKAKPLPDFYYQTSKEIEQYIKFIFFFILFIILIF